MAAGLLGVVVAATAAQGQEQFYYAGLTESENSEVYAWSVHYWTRVDNGGGAPGAGFSFTNPVMNSQLFNPVRSARPTLELLGQISPTLCDRLYDLPVGLDPVTAEQRAMIRDLMLTGTLQTVDGTPANWAHGLLILAAPPENEWLAWSEGATTFSVGLPLAEISPQTADAALELNASEESQSIIASLIAAGGYWRSQCTDVPQWKTLITGELSTAEQFWILVDDYLWLRGEPVAISRLVQANFGVFGELPVIVVGLSDCFMLMDPTNGNLSGP